MHNTIINSTIQSFKATILNKIRIRIIILTMVILILYSITNINKFGLNFSIYNFVIFILNNPLNVTFIFTTCFLLLIIDLGNFKSNEAFCILRCGSRLNWYISKVLCIGISAVFFNLLVVFLIFISGIMKFSIKNSWDSNIVLLSSTDHNFNIALNISKELLVAFSPLKSVIVSIGLLTLYLIVVGLLNFIINAIAKNNAVGFLSVEVIIFLSLIIYKKELLYNNLIKFILIKNALLQEHTFNNINFLSTLLFSFLYFLMIVIILKFIGFALFKRIDLDNKTKIDSYK